jgi:anthranilate phosphoribosyltransferase
LDSDSRHFAGFVATLGRGPGRSRALTRAEAAEAFAMVLDGRADPLQVGAFLMLLRYRGEDPDEMVGLVEAARRQAGLPAPLGVDLDWPSYGAGRTRGAPWFLLAALALARSGVRVLMHGTNEFSAGQSVEQALGELHIAPCSNLAEAAVALDRDRFAYLKLERLSPAMARLIGLRALFGLRSPVNTAARLLDPGGAACGVDGVFHPPYIDVHLGVAERMGRRLAVVKGGGGEAERNPAKPVAVHVWSPDAGRSELTLPARPPTGPAAVEDVAAVWNGAPSPVAPSPGGNIARATIALALVALGRADAQTADALADDVWEARR